MSNNRTVKEADSKEYFTLLVRGLGSRSILHQQGIVGQLGMSANDFISIDLLNEEGPMTAGELATRTGLSTGTMTALIDRLEKIGYAKREKDPLDRRRVMIVPTYEDKEEIQQVYEPIHQAMLALANQYSEEEITFINHFLENTNAVLDQQLKEMES